MSHTPQQRIARLTARATRAYERKDAKQATKLAAQAYDLALGATNQLDQTLVDVLDDLASLLLDLGQSDKAIALYEQSLHITQATYGEQHPDVAARLNDLGTLYYSVGNYPTAEREFAQALEIRRSVLGSQHHDTAQSLNSLAALYYATGSYAAATSL